MPPVKFLTLRIATTPDWVSARCPEFGIGTFADTADNAKVRLFDNVKAMSYVIVAKRNNGEAINEDLFKYANIINNNGANLKEYFKVVEE